MSSACEAQILAGTHVAIHGLSARSDLNGCSGIVVAFDRAADRYVIRLDGALGDEAYFRVRERCLTKKRRELSEAGAESLAKLMCAQGILSGATIFTNSCESSSAGVVNQSHFKKEVSSAVVTGSGRVSLACIRTTLGVDSIDQFIEDVVKSGDYRMLSATGDLVTIGWVESLASAVVKEALERYVVPCNQRAAEAEIPTEFLESIITEGLASGRLQGVRFDASHRCIVSLSFDHAVTDAIAQACHAVTEPLGLTASILAVQQGCPPSIGMRKSSDAAEKVEDQSLFQSLLDDDYIHAASMTLTDKVPGLIRGGGREFVPNAFITSIRKDAVAVFSRDGYLALDSPLTKQLAALSNAPSDSADKAITALRVVLDGEDIVELSRCILSRARAKVLRRSVAASLSQHQWIDLAALVESESPLASIDEAHALIADLLPVGDALPFMLPFERSDKVNLRTAAAAVARTSGDWPESALFLDPFIVPRGFAYMALVTATEAVARRVRGSKGMSKSQPKDEEEEVFFIAGAANASAAAAVSVPEPSAKEKRKQASKPSKAKNDAEVDDEGGDNDRADSGSSSLFDAPNRQEVVDALSEWQTTLPTPLVEDLAAAILPSVVAAHSYLLTVGAGLTTRGQASLRTTLEKAFDSAYRRLKMAARAADTLRDKWQHQEGLGDQDSLQRELHRAVVTGPGAVVVELLLRWAADPPRLTDAELSTVGPEGDVLQLTRVDCCGSSHASGVLVGTLATPLAKLLKLRALPSVADESLRADFAHVVDLALEDPAENGSMWAGEFVSQIETKLMEACGQVVRKVDKKQEKASLSSMRRRCVSVLSRAPPSTKNGWPHGLERGDALDVLRAAIVLMLVLSKNLLPFVPLELSGLRPLLSALQGHIEAKPYSALRELFDCLENNDDEEDEVLQVRVQRVRDIGTSKDPTSCVL